MPNTVLRAAALAAALFSMLLVAPAGAEPGQRIAATPAVGECHAFTLEEGLKASDPDPAVPCTEAHTSYTFKVLQLTDPDWDDRAALDRLTARRCVPAEIDQLGARMKSIRRSAFKLFWFRPTKAQRDAGASWIRCDLTLLGGRKLVKLPGEDDPKLGSLPLPDSVARCRTGKNLGYVVTVCSRNHSFRATLALKLRETKYPGNRAARAEALRKCRAHLETAFYYEYPPSPLDWKLGDHYAVCLPKTTS